MNDGSRRFTRWKRESRESKTTKRKETRRKAAAGKSRKTPLRESHPRPLAGRIPGPGGKKETPLRQRPTWEDYFLEITRLVAKRSTCLRREVGAVLVMDKRILATGYNGAPSGLAHCVEGGCIREIQHIPSGECHELCRGLHAEQNAIIQAAFHGIRIQGATLYCTTHPCAICAKMIINAGIREVFYESGYGDALARDMLKEAGIRLRQILPQKAELPSH